MSDKALENGMRRKAKRLGMRVEKSRTRKVHVNDFGGFQLVNDRNVVVAGDRYNLDLAGLAEALEIEIASATA